MIFGILLYINELQPDCGVVTGVSCLFLIVSFLVAGEGGYADALCACAP